MSLNTGMSRTSMLMYVDNSIHQIKHLDITLEVVSPSDRHGRIYINDSWSSFEHKFGIEMNSFINHQSHPARQSHPV